MSWHVTRLAELSAKTAIVGFFTINNAHKQVFFSYKYLGIYVDAALSWSVHVDYVCGKIQRRIYFLRTN